MENQDPRDPDSSDPSEPPRPHRDLWSRSAWLARFSFSFLIVGIYLAYTGYRGAESGEMSRGRTILCYVGAAFAFVLFLMGTREKHRPRG